MWRVSAEPQRFDEAIDWFRQRVPLERSEWDQLTEQARRQAFTVSGVAELDVVADVHQALLRAVEEGTSYSEFRRAVAANLTSAWGRPQSARVRTIWQTNIQQAYSAGRYQQMTDPEMASARPYFMYDAVLDSRTSSICRNLNGTVLPQDDPFWDTHIPPLHFGCRSGLRSLTRRAAESRGITATPPKEPPQTGFGARPQPGEWGREWAKGQTEYANRPDWKPAFVGDAPTFRDYGLPQRLPVNPMPVALLPTVEEVGGREAFYRLLEQRWGAREIDLEMPTGTIVKITEEALLKHVIGREDKRERFLPLLPDLVQRPAEIWLTPEVNDRGTVVFKQRLVKVYEDSRNRSLIFSSEMLRGAWTGFTFFETKHISNLNKQRQGFLRWKD
jgi:SPP1 gp7 family putative phage head morphogenesis protein